MSKKFRFHQDVSHGWLAVKLQDLADLEISRHISKYSYVKGQTAYLEEDCDMSVFVAAWKQKYILPPEIVYSDNRPFRSFIRNLTRYEF